MARIGILSMQRIINYGSFLQAYGLKMILEDMGHEVCFVDYHVGVPLDKNQNTSLKRKRLYKKISEVMNYDASFVQKMQFLFYKKNFALKYQSVLGIGKEFVYRPELDLLIIGSDEVFNCTQKNANVGYSPELFGKDHKAKKLISYAASFGNTTLEKLRIYGKEKEIGELLKGFDAISVRDKNSGEIVKALSGKESRYHLDPVLIYDYIGKCALIPELVQKEKYLILYAYSGRILSEEAEWISKYAKRKNLKIYAIGGIHRCADKFISCSPFEVLAYFKDAVEIVTDTFHGTIFSIITKRPFVTIVRKSIGGTYGNEEKLTDLLDRLALADRAVRNIGKAEDVLAREINYGKVDEIRKREVENSRCYLSCFAGEVGLE